ncbi:hypothetical protein GE061_000906 [Apolygus lucorum]|uniref:Zinc finger PHD-type domain-containing protein n=1 Tax=Apolygus lucorum TaxID=248454 RepID=A0A6A4KKP5_APOLU|nr:hypothetical protein GE061_000906 [Apolygus lucorum]
MFCSAPTCGKRLPLDGNFATCSSEVGCAYHFDCTTIVERTWFQWSGRQRSNWVCPKHRQVRIYTLKRKPENNLCGPVIKKTSEELDSSVVPALLNEIRPADPLPTKHQEQDNMSEIEELKNFLSNLINSKTNEVLAKIGVLDEQLRETKKEIVELKAENSILKTQNERLELEVRGLNQLNRNKNVIINGIPESKEENIPEILTHLANKVGVTVDQELHIDEIFRIPNSKPNVPRPILVQFISLKKRNEFAIAARIHKPKLSILSDCLREVDPDIPIYINDHLTPANSEIRKNCNSLKREGRIFGVQVRKGRIYIKTSEQEPYEGISTTQQIEKKFGVVFPKK